MTELEEKLWNIPDAYEDFVTGVLAYAGIPDSHTKIQRISRFLSENPLAVSSDVVEFVSKQADFKAKRSSQQLAVAG